MAIPASVIPAGNSYSVHVAGAGDAEPLADVLSVTAAAAAALLDAYGVDVRQHLTGDDAVSRKRRDFLGRAGAKASAFSPAPNPGLPGEGFWKATLAVVHASGSDFWWPPRAEKKVEWDPLLVALHAERDPGPGVLPAAQIAAPDLWIAATDEEDAAAAATRWIDAGAGAVAVIGRAGAAWASRNAAFGNARGAKRFDADARDATPPGPWGSLAFGLFAGGVIAGLVEELLGENLFDKGIIRVERDELEARPLRVGRAVSTGAAAARAREAIAAEGSPERLLHKDGDLRGKVRAHLREEQRAAFPQGAPKPWGTKGR